MILSLGSVNADFVVKSDSAPSGPGTVLAHDLLRTSGGKGANVALLAARLGAPARLLGCVGDDGLADQALAGPRAAGVDVTAVQQRPGPTAYSSVIVTPDGDKTIVLALNANDAWGDGDGRDAVAAEVAAAPAGSVVVVDCEVPATLVAAALEAARGRGLVSILDPAPPSRLDRSVLPFASHLTPDHLEATRLTGIDIGDDHDSAAQAAAQLHDETGGVVYVKLSDGGCSVAGVEGLARVHAPSDIEVVDKTGAGDAFAGGLAWAIWTGRAPIDAARTAVAASSCAVTAYGSQESYPSPEALAAMLGRVTVTNR